MMDDDLDSAMLIGLHKLAGQNGDGLVPALHERLIDRQAQKAASAEIIAIPALHQRKAKPIYSQSSWGDATIIDFPAPKWLRNAARQRG
ncbi:hypothetical protein J5N58_24600 [Rhizobium cremeum]|uniref:hypothetical protein n=1 Tax=Rhizobium cremeum TaxID=2813827 RepID=UPI000DE530DB|nr:hypothetical protein [Rhizobium cremeum]MCJ7997774.1 hypothetical protein [Rhizobium cremeum]MCJ8002868.1 hypothetical protein [Rhizobium cremeum]